MFFAVDCQGKAQVLLPESQLKLIFVHCAVPQANDSLHNLVMGELLA